MFFFGKSPRNILARFLLDCLFFFFRLSFLNDLFWIPNALSDIYTVNTSLTLLITFLFTLSIMPFNEQKFLILIYSKLSTL